MAALAMNSPEERVQYLDETCGDDAELRQRVEELLAAQEQSDDFLIPEWMEDDDILEGPGTIIGHYKLLEEIGEGGFGVVFMADQIEPIRRRVALKVVKPGMDSKQVIARFEAERQAVAMMDHPNIAHVYDAGTTDSGRPYFVMELVPGMPITEYCDNAKLTREERIKLFIPVCEAIQHAHQKGVIHRDIKPSNILVTLHDGKPVPKVIDFGTAKALHQPLTNRTMFTSYGSFVGTPQYMSPEQAEMSGLDIDTRADIYSLGVLLYELLTGTTPFEAERLRTMAFDKMMRMIREEDPPKPSTRVSTLGEKVMDIANYRKMDPKALRRSLQGDLDSIVMKALEKDRKRRYETASELALDLQRHLATEPVVARPPSKLYEFQKTVRRHKVGFAATAGVILVLCVGVVVSAWQAHLAHLAQQQAEHNAQKALDLQQQAVKDELTARQRAYASDMNVAKQVLDAGNLGRALYLLNRQRPKPGQKDLRGWEWRYLWKQTRSSALFSLCKRFEVISLAVSPDSKWLAVGTTGLDGGESLSLWNLHTRQEIPQPGLMVGQEGVQVAFSPTQPLLAIASASPPSNGSQRFTLNLWNTATRQMIAVQTLDTLCRGLVFSDDGQTLATITEKGHITLWNIPDATPLASYPCEQFTLMVGPVIGFATTRDLSLAAYAFSGNQICVIDLHTGHKRLISNAAKQYVTALAFSPDGKTLASGGGFAESDIRLWDVADGKEIARLEGHKAWIGSLVFWPDGSRLASCSGDQTIRVWNVRERKCLDVLHGHTAEVWSLALLPDDKTMVSGSKDGEVCLWDTSYKHDTPPQYTVPGTVWGWDFVSSGRSVLTLAANGSVERWDGEDFEHPTLVMDVGTNYFDARFSADGHYLATGSTNGIVSIWDLSTKELCQQLKGESGLVVPLQFLEPEPRLLTEYLERGDVNLWDVPEARMLYSWRTPAYCGPAISPDSTKAVFIGFRREVVCADLSTGGETKLDFNPAVVASGSSFSPLGNLFAISSYAGFIQVYNTDTDPWQELVRLSGYRQGLVSVGFSPDGKRLVSGGDVVEALRFWDTESWQDVLTLECKEADFWETAFSSDGNTLGARNMEGVLHLWHAPSWDEIRAAEMGSGPDRTDL